MRTQFALRNALSWVIAPDLTATTCLQYDDAHPFTSTPPFPDAQISACHADPPHDSRLRTPVCPALRSDTCAHRRPDSALRRLHRIVEKHFARRSATV